MTIYTYSRDDLKGIKEKVGWFNNCIHNKLDCVLATRNVLRNHGHELKVELFISAVGEYEQVEPVIREVEAGYYITDMFDELNYAYFSKDMNCAKSCAKAVLEVMQG
jgi:hypothetical protein